MSNCQLTRGMVDALFAYLDQLEHEVRTGDSLPDRSELGLPAYRFDDRSSASGIFSSCGAPVKFVFPSSERAEATKPATGSWRPQTTINDPAKCRLCFPNLVRQEFSVDDMKLVLVRNPLPYGAHHGVVRSASHESQAECFEDRRISVALHIAKALGSDLGPADYEVWVAGEGFNTQWHYHVQFRRTRSPVWHYIDKVLRPELLERQVLIGYPSQPVYFQSADEGTLRRLLREHTSSVADHGSPEDEIEAIIARGLLASYEYGRWRLLFVTSRPTGRVFGKPLGLHEHLGEVILEDRDEFVRISGNVVKATADLERQLVSWAANREAG